MKIQTINLSTTTQYALVDITDKVEKVVSESGVKNGLCIINIPHATAALIVNEDEEGLKGDVMNRVQQLAPDENTFYSHNRIDDNARAHIISAIVGAEKTLIIEDGRLTRGTWQQLFFVELDGPRPQRRVLVKVLSDERMGSL